MNIITKALTKTLEIIKAVIELYAELKMKKPNNIEESLNITDTISIYI